MAKVGRNERCPCGSGKKFKRCHGTLTRAEEMETQIRKAMERAQAADTQRKRQQGFGRPIISTEADSGYRLVAVKNRLMYSKGWKTFNDFLVDYIKAAMNSGPGAENWGSVEIAKAPADRHPVITWYQMVCDYQRTFIHEPGKIHSAEMTGAVAAYMFLAYDLYSLDHNAELQTKLLARLRNHDNFEGARYEIFVAASLIRAGFELEFENEDDRTTSHCEFTATFTRTGRKFSVEAKHRAGARPRMGHLLIGALQKRANHPRIVFVDVNMPDDGTEADGPPLMNSAIRKLRGFEHKTVNGKALPPAYLIVTNTPYQHHLNSASFRCCADVDGFQIPDFKANAAMPTLREAIVAREAHIEMHELMRSIQDHTHIPVTFDGEIPEFAFGNVLPRLVIGQTYLVPDAEGKERPGVLTSAEVMEKEKQALCSLSFDGGGSVICTWPLSDKEMAAWRRHPDTFFGVLTQRKRKADTPLELYDFFFECFCKLPKDRLLEALRGAPDVQELAALDQAALASIYAERCVYAAYRTSAQPA